MSQDAAPLRKASNPGTLRVVKPAAAELWPKNVPGPEVAGIALRGGSCPAAFRELTSKLVSALSEVESAAVWGRAGAVDLTPLREGLVARWRLEVAMVTKPAQGPVDNAELDAMLAQADGVLQGLKVPEGAEPHVAAAFNNLKGVLVKYAVALSTVAIPAPDVPLPQTPVKEPTSAPKVLVYNPADEKKDKARGRKTLALGIACGVVVLLAAGFHVTRFILQNDTGAPVVKDPNAVLVPDGLMATRNPASGDLDIMVLDRNLVTPAVLESLRQRATGEGKELVQLGPDAYRITRPKAATPTEKP